MMINRNPDWQPQRRIEGDDSIPLEWAEQGTLTCEDGHQYPAIAGECPYDDASTRVFLEQAAYVDSERALVSGAPLLTTNVSALLADWVASDIVAWMDNGRAPRTMHDYGYARKIGVVNHIPVCQTLDQLTAYFNGGSAQGSSHFGIGRDAPWIYRIPGTHTLFHCAQVHQYMPLRGVSPWAQGVIARSDRCPIRPAPAIAGMRPGEPNGAFASIENVAMTGDQGVTDAQFNSNVFLRAYLAALDGYEITPRTQLWHAEIDQANRCNDPGWPGGLEDEMQEAARKLLQGDVIGIRGRWSDEADPSPPLPPAPPPPAVGRETRIEPIGAPSTVVGWTEKDDERLIITTQRVRLVRDA